MSACGYLRHPTICRDAIVFVCDDDLWRVDAAGGVARRLTAGLGEVGYPSISANGEWLAYVGRDELHPEVYLMPSRGGPDWLRKRGEGYQFYGQPPLALIVRRTAAKSAIAQAASGR